MAYDSKAVANYFLNLSKVDDEPLTPMKLLKLLYYAHGWYLAICGQPLLDERIEAWEYGPVVPSIYSEFKHFGNNPISTPATEWKLTGDDDDLFGFNVVSPTIPDGEENEFVRQLLQRIWEIYKPFSAIQLSSMTHETGSPWEKVLRGHEKGCAPRHLVIDDNIIREFFIGKLTTNSA